MRERINNWITVIEKGGNLVQYVIQDILKKLTRHTPNPVIGILFDRSAIFTVEIVPIIAFDVHRTPKVTSLIQMLQFQSLRFVLGPVVDGKFPI